MEKKRIKLGDIFMDAVVDENPNMTADVTNKAVEKGQDISDHMKQNPYTLKISGSIVKESAEKLELLRSYQRDAKLIKYVGRGVYTDVVLLSIDTKHNSNNATGFDYDLSLQHVRIARPETFEVKVKDPVKKEKDPKTATKVKAKTNAGRKQVKEK